MAKSLQEITKGKADKGQRLQELINQSGWQDVMNILQDIWMDGFGKLKESDGELARAQMLVVEKIFTQIGVSIDFGEKAREKYLVLKNKEK